MARYIARRLFFMLPVALLICFVTFMTIHLIPGDPARVLLGEFATPQAIAALHQQLGLDKPLPTQFALWLWQALHGNLGQSIQLQQPVLDAILQRLPVTAELGICSLLFSLVLAIPLGIYSATHRNNWIDWLANVSSLFSTAIPGFVLGLVLIFFFAVDIRLFPPGGYVSFDEDALSNIRDLILPMVTLGAGAVALNMRQIRASMIEALSQDYIRTARAKGLSERRVSYLHSMAGAGRFARLAHTFRRDPRLWFGVLLLLFMIAAIFAPIISPYSPLLYHPSITGQGPSLAHLLGTDALGRDQLSCVIYGTRISLSVGIATILIGGVLGTLLGIIGAYLKGWVDQVIIMVVDALLSFPSLILALAIAAALGPSIINVVIALAVVRIPIYARIARGQTLQVAAQDYVTAAEVSGSTTGKIMLRHILPNIFSPLLVQATLSISLSLEMPCETASIPGI